MSRDNIIVIAVDGLRATALGAYGNTWYDTPWLDRLAASSLLAEWCFASAIDLPEIYRSLWSAIHPLRTSQRGIEPPSLPQQLAECGYRTMLISDDPHLSECPGADAFTHVEWVDHATTSVATDLAHTQLAHLFSRVQALVAQSCAVPNSGSESLPTFTWIHARGLYGAWDAPLEMRSELVEEEDPEPYDGHATPHASMDHQHDEDARFSYSCAYAAQVRALDACIGALMESIGEANGNVASEYTDGRFVVVLLGVRGFPLGEHGRVGGADSRLTVEQLHVPMLWCFPDGTGRLSRCTELIEHVDVAPTIIDGLGVEINGPHDGRSLLPLIDGNCAHWRDHIVAAGPAKARAIRTSSWSLRPGHEVDRKSDVATADAERPPGGHKLFVRPDDSFEVNDVADLCTDVVEGLSRALQAVESACQQDRPLDLPPLPAELRVRGD